MDWIRDADIDRTALAGKRVAIIGFGNQGRAQALNLRDSGVDVVVALREGSDTRLRWRRPGCRLRRSSEAVGDADVVMLLAPDEIHAALYGQIEPQSARRCGAGIQPRPVDPVRFDPAARRPRRVPGRPKGPGTALRSPIRRQRNDRRRGRWRRMHRQVREIALAYGGAIGCGRAG